MSESPAPRAPQHNAKSHSSAGSSVIAGMGFPISVTLFEDYLHLQQKLATVILFKLHCILLFPKQHFQQSLQSNTAQYTSPCW